MLVPNAAAMVFGHFAEVDADDFDRTVAVTFTGPVNVVRAALPHLRRAGGTIVATGSLNSRVPLPAFWSYAASKHALRGFLNTLRIEEIEQRTDVQVAMVHPGPVDTPVFERSTSATGRRPRRPADAYRPEVVAKALVETAVNPRPVSFVGAENAYGRPAVRCRPAGREARVARRRSLVPHRGRAGAGTGSALPPARARGGLRGHAGARQPARLGALWPPVASPSTPFKLVSNLAGTAAEGIRLLPQLASGPVPEVPASDHAVPSSRPAERKPRVQVL